MSVSRDQFKHVYWIGGGSRGGKSTLARRLAAEYGWQVYETDASVAGHARRSNPEKHPLLTKFMAMDMDERWVTRSPETMLETFPWYRGECFEMIVEDILALPKDRPIVVEGFRLLPTALQPLVQTGNAIWLLPTPHFREYALEASGKGGWEFLQKTSDPDRAQQNLLQRDKLFTERLSNEMKSLGLPSIKIDIGMSQEDVAKQAVQILAI